MTSQIQFFVFSYNRGPFLEHCVGSIARCAPTAEIVVFDDQSTDPETRRVLERLSARHKVVSSGGGLGHKHGGLYANMQAALDTVEDDRLICFTQDDTQMVRSIDESDLRFIEDCFAKRPDIGFISPLFLQEFRVRRIGATAYRYDPQIGLFFRDDTGRSAGTYYSDIFMSTAGRLRNAGWVFERGEPRNQIQAKAKFGPIGYLAKPFMMYLPNGPAYRGKAKTLALRLAERVRRCGFYPFEHMTEDAVRSLATCGPSRLPIAEHFLRTVDGDLSKPWIYSPLQGSRLLKHLNRLELLARSAFR